MSPCWGRGLKVLISGASGFIGRNVLRACPRSWDVVATWHRSEDFPSFLEAHGLSHVLGFRCDLRTADGAEALAEFVGGRADAVLHLVSSGNPAWSEAHPAEELCFTAVPLARLCERVATERLVFVSSGAVYEGLTGEVKPGLPLHPTLPYAVAKLAAERLVEFFRQRGRLGSYVIARLMGAYGPYEAPRKIYTRLVEAFGVRRERRFELRGDGQNWIDAMYVDDAVRGLLAMLTGAPSDLTVDFGVGAPLTLDELVRAAARTFGIDDVEIVHTGAVAEHHRFHVSAGRVAELYGFRPQVSLEEGLRRLHRWIVERRE